MKSRQQTKGRTGRKHTGRGMAARRRGTSMRRLRSSGGRKAARGRQAGRSGGRSRQASSQATTDHDEIRNWVESRGGHPAIVKRTSRSGQGGGVLRIDFPGFSGGRSLEAVPWDEWFEVFDRQQLAFLHQDTTAGGKSSRFNKLVTREGSPRRRKTARR